MSYRWCSCVTVSLCLFLCVFWGFTNNSLDCADHLLHRPTISRHSEFNTNSTIKTLFARFLVITLCICTCLIWHYLVLPASCMQILIHQDHSALQQRSQTTGSRPSMGPWKSCLWVARTFWENCIYIRHSVIYYTLVIVLSILYFHLLYAIAME